MCQRRTCTRIGNRPGQLCEQHYRVTPHGFIDATQAQEHVRALRAAGYGWDELAKRTGLSDRALSLVGKWTDQATVTVDTHERIMSVAIPSGFVSGRGLIPATGTRRRIQALMAMGWTQGHLAREMGLSDSKNVSDITRRAAVLSCTASKVAAVYVRLHMTPGPSECLRQRAKKWGFAPPLAWDENAIDDPAARPNKGQHVPTSSARKIDELYNLGVRDVSGIADRLGIQATSVKRQLERQKSSRRRLDEAALCG